MKEKKLLFLVRTKKDKHAFGGLYDLYVEKIYRFVYFKINNKEEAEDLVSEVFLKTWNYLIEYSEKEITSFSGLIYRITRNAVVDYYRKKANHPEQPLDYLEIDIADESEEMEKLSISQDVEQVMKLMKRMKQDYQEIVMLRFVEELNINEISQILDKSKVSVRVTLHRALKKLKELSDQ